MVMQATVVAPPAAPSRAMVSPWIDTACIGGLSLVVSAGLLAFGRVPFEAHAPSFLPYALTAAITWPHFLSSYRVLYATRESVLTYRRASLYFPAALAAYCAFAVAVSPRSQLHLHVLALVAAVYLARHYTGQTWGMMASFSFIRGIAFEPLERRICQWGLNLIMVWHITWAAARGIGGVAPSLEPAVLKLDSNVDVLAFLSFAVGLVGLGRMSRRIGALPPARVLVPWLALYGWYALLRRDPTNLVVVQSAHALQYLIFPLRIAETRRQDRPAPVQPGYAAAWLAGLMFMGLAAFAGIPALFRIGYEEASGVGDLSAAFLSAFVSFVNIHHYFVDGCLYKLRNPVVRRDLFAHLG